MKDVKGKPKLKLIKGGNKPRPSNLGDGWEDFIRRHLVTLVKKEA